MRLKIYSILTSKIQNILSYKVYIHQNNLKTGFISFMLNHKIKAGKFFGML